MSDIFISYASEERDRILPLVSALEKTGWSVFWDRTIPAGRTWRRIIGSEIKVCRSVIVVWTEKSITSEWVHEEAEVGKRKRILIPVLLDNIEPPFGFGIIQAANLSAWNGDNSSPIFTRLVADIATILGPAPGAVKEAAERRRLVTEAQRKAEGERIRQQERQRSEEEARRKDEEEKRKRVEQEANRARLRDEKRLPSEVKPARKESPAASQQDALVPEHLIRPDRRQLYAGAAVVIVIGLAVMTFWFFAPPGIKENEVKKIVSLGIQGKRQLNVGEKTLLRVGGRFADGSEADITENLDWHSSDDSVVAVSGDGQVEARKDGFADIIVRYEGTASPPLTLVIRGESRSAETDAARVASKVQEHIKTARLHRDRGEYSTALAELANAEALDPVNQIIQNELERTKEAKRRWEVEAKRREYDKRRADEEKRRQAAVERKTQEEVKQRSEEPQKNVTTPVFIPPSF